MDLWLQSPSRSHGLLPGKTKPKNLRHHVGSHSGHWNSIQWLSITFIVGVFKSGIIVILVQDDNIYLTHSNEWFRCLICCCHSDRIFPLFFSIKYLNSCQNSWKQIKYQRVKILRNWQYSTFRCLSVNTLRYSAID